MQMKRLIYTLLLVMTVTAAQAQNIVRGTVTDETGDALPGATVAVMGAKGAGTTTDSQGRYALTLPGTGEYTLQVTYLGYISQTRTVRAAAADAKQSIDFTLAEDAIGLETVVVTGTRTPKLLKDAPIITRVISEDDIKKVDATHIGDLLEQELPGLEFSYAMNQQVTLNMQGFGGTTVLFLVDGEKLAGETMDNVDYSRLNLDNVGRVEIVKGAASSLYGSNAMGGVVNLISKESTEPWTANVNAHLGEYGEQRYGGTVTFNAGRFFNTFNIQHTEKDDVDLPSDGDYSKIYGSETWNFKDRLVYNVTKNFKLTGRLGYFFRERNYSADEKNRYRDFSGGLRANWKISDKDDLEVAYQYDQYDKSDYYPTTTKYDLKDYSNVQNVVRALYNHSFTDNHILTFGGDYMRDYLESYQFSDGETHKQYVGDIFGQFDWNVTDKFNVILGARFDSYSEADVHHLSPKVGLMYKLGSVNLRGSYSGGFRAPTLKEMYMSYDMASIFMIYGNADLKPETSQNFQLSAEYSKRYFNGSLSGYYNFVDDRITTVWDQSLNGMFYSNISRMRIYGIEANASLKLPCGFAARASYVYAKEHVKKGEIYQAYTSTTRPHTATVRVEYGKNYDHGHGFNVSLSGRLLSHVNTWEYSSYVQNADGEMDTEEVRYPGYALWKLMFSQRILGGITLSATVDNLFDYVPSYYYNNSPTTVGRTFSITMSFDIDEIVKRKD